MPPHRLEVFFDGEVQGVGFRARTQQVALNFDVTGYVENLPDGRVHLLLEGDPAEMRACLREVEIACQSHIAQVDQALGSATGEFSGFHILRNR